MTDTLARDLVDTAAALENGWPIENLNRLRRARAMNTTTDTETASDYRDLVERATPMLVEIRRASGGGAKMDVHDDDIAAAVLAMEPDSDIRHHTVDGSHEFWVIETTEWRCFTKRRPAGK